VRLKRSSIRRYDSPSHADGIIKADETAKWGRSCRFAFAVNAKQFPPLLFISYILICSPHGFALVTLW